MSLQDFKTCLFLDEQSTQKKTNNESIMGNSSYLFHSIFSLEFWLRNGNSVYRYLVPTAHQKAAHRTLCSRVTDIHGERMKIMSLQVLQQWDSEYVGRQTLFHLFCYKCTLWNLQLSYNLNTGTGKTVKRILYY